MVQLAAVLADGQTEQTLSTLIYPAGWRIEPGAFAVHRISEAQAKASGISIAEAIQQFNAMLELAELAVAHNVEFDRLILDSEYMRLGLRAAWPRTFCTMLNLTDVLCIPFPSGGPRYKWPTLSEAYFHFFGAHLVKSHDALADVRACQRVFHRAFRIEMAEPS